MYISTHVWMNICMNLCIDAYMYAGRHFIMYVHAYTITHIYAKIHMYVIYIYVYMYVGGQEWAYRWVPVKLHSG